MKVLILGGYGVFGGRLAGLLSNVPELELFIAGRSLDKAQAFCRAYQGQAKVRPVQLDRKDISKYLEAERPYLLDMDGSWPSTRGSAQGA